MRLATITLIFLMGVKFAYGEAREWQGVNPSTSLLARAGTGVTHPIAADLPNWSRRNAVDVSFISGNPALLSMLHEFRGRKIPIAVQSLGAGGRFNSSDALVERFESAALLANELKLDKGTRQRGKLVGSSHWIQKDLGVNFYLSEERNALLTGGNELQYERYRDLGFQLGAGGLIIDRETVGRFEFGMSVKAIGRMGDEVEITDALASNQTLKDSDFKRVAFAGGVDYGLLYTADPKLTGAWKLQAGFVWRDLGTTQFTLGQRTSTGRRFGFLPNNQIFGVGLGLPKIRDGIRSAIRIEYGEWSRRVATIDKLSASFEFRLPVWATLNLGISGKHASGGLVFRFPGFETEIATVSQLWGEGAGAKRTRSLMLEIRGAI